MNLQEYLSRAIEHLIWDAGKAFLANPREGAFLLQYRLAAKAAEKRRREHEAVGEHIPPFLIASIASNCNLFCKGCYARANHSCGENREELSAARWGEIFDEARELGVAFILLAGGEPLMRRDVMEKAAEYPQIVFPVFTNGTMLRSAYLPLFDSHRNLLPVLSIEGNEKETDARRGAGVYRMLLSTMEELNGRGIFYGASVTVTSQNLTAVTAPEFVGNLWEKGCRLILFVEYVPVDSATQELALGERERAVLEERQDRLREQFETMIFLSFPGDEKHTEGCLAAGRGFFHIGADGSAEPCPFSPYSDTSMKNSDLIHALRSPFFQKLRNEGMLLEEHTGGCVLFQKQAEVAGLLK